MNYYIKKKKLKECLLDILILFSLISTLLISGVEHNLHGNLIMIAVSIFYIVLFLQHIKLKEFEIFFILFFIVLVFCYGYIHPKFSDSIKSLLYLFPFILFLHKDTNLVERLQTIVIKFAMLCIILFFLRIGVDSAYGAKRMQGLMSEPSAFAFCSSLLLVNFLETKKKLPLFLTFICIIMTKSPTVMLVTVGTFFLYLFFKQNLLMKVLIATIALILLLNLQSICIFLYDKTEIYSFNRLALGMEALSSLGKGGYNPRLFTVFYIFDSFNDTDLFTKLFGMGWASQTYYFTSKGMMANICWWLDIYISFGLIGLSIFLVALFLSFLKLRSQPNLEKYSFLAIFMYVLINTAMGIQLQLYFYALLLMILSSKIKSTKIIKYFFTIKKTSNTKNTKQFGVKNVPKKNCSFA